MNLYDSLPDAAGTVFGEEAVGSFAYSVLTVDVPTASWIPALEIARDKLGCTYFDWLSAVDEPGTGFRICAHVVSLENHRVRRLLLRTTVPHSAPSLPSAVPVYAGTEWHERETFEMFGIVFTNHPNLVPLLLPENFEGHPLRKDFVLAARVAKAWPGAKEPGEGHDPDAPKRRQMLPPGVPDPNDWGPMKGQLPPAPARPARTPRAAAGAPGERPARAPREGAPTRRPRPTTADATTAEPETLATPTDAASAPPATTETVPGRPVRRSRSVTEGSASQAEASPTAPPVTAEASAAEAKAPVTPASPEAAPGSPVRRSRSASEGSASQAEVLSETAGTPETEPGTGGATARTPRRTRSVADGSASQAPAPAEAEGEPAAEPQAPARPVRGSTDAPWHNPKPAFDTPPAQPADSAEPEGAPAPASERKPVSEPEPESPSEREPASERGSAAKPAPESPSERKPASEPEPESASERKPESESGSEPDPASESDTTPNDPTGGAA